MPAVDDLQFEMERRMILFHRDTSMPDATQLGYVGDPNLIVTPVTPGETLLYNAPSGTRYLDKGTSPYSRWVKVDDIAGGLWQYEGTGSTAHIPQYTTLLTVTQSVPAGSSFFVNSGGTYYIKEKEDGYLGVDSNEFLYDEAIQIYLNGSKVIKGDHVQWTSEYSFNFGFAVDVGDTIEVIS